MSKITGIHHIELNVRDQERSLEFYRHLAAFFPESEIVEEGKSFRWNMAGFYLWFNPVKDRFADREYHRKSVGLDHLAFRVKSRKVVDGLQAYLIEKGVPILYEAGLYGPTYYAVYFEDPDRFKLEFGTD